MTEHQKIDLGAEGLIAAKEEKQAEPTLEEFIGNILGGLQILEDSVGSLHIAIRTLGARVGTCERFLSYLMTKDPEANKKLQEHLEKMAAAEKLAAETAANTQE